MSKLILAVEDQEDNMQILRDLLTSAGYEMIEAENGEEALAAVAKRRPDLILMDIQIPIIDGYEVTRRIKADPALRSIPIIAVTSHAMAAVKKKRARLAVMISWPSPIARASYWRRFASTCPKRLHFDPSPSEAHWWSAPLDSYKRRQTLTRALISQRTSGLPSNALPNAPPTHCQRLSGGVCSPRSFPR